MKTTCPSCKCEMEVPDGRHYQIVSCGGCGNRFQALSDDTQKLSRSFLDQVLRKRPPEDESEAEGD